MSSSVAPSSLQLLIVDFTYVLWFFARSITLDDAIIWRRNGMKGGDLMGGQGALNIRQEEILRNQPHVADFKES
jgi:hypothetical protein